MYLRSPLKVKLWYLFRGVMLAKDDLAKKNWNSSMLCAFRDQEKTIGRLFLH